MRDSDTVRILNREILLLIALALAASGVFVFTKTMALREQQMESRIARVWFERGQESIASRKIETAIADFRRATSRAGENQHYALALADALARGNHDPEAQQLLARLRETDPENAEINIYLARLAAKQRLVSDAVHYYRNALYGRWAGSGIDARRRELRVELVHFLLEHGERDLASSEILILRTELPNEAGSWIEGAKLSVQAEDLQQALKDYSQAARLDHQNVEALTGAGNISFQLRDYFGARRFLKAALELEPQSAEVRQRLWLAETVLNEDPLAPRLASGERQRRLVRDFALSLQRLESCANENTNRQSAQLLQSLKTEALATEPKLSRQNSTPDSDMIDAGINLMFRMEQAAAEACGELSRSDQALLLIGQLHNGGRQ